jgi:hypothetical protein
MHKRLLVSLAVIAASLLLSAGVSASTTVDVKATINQPGMHVPATCPVPPLCGTGEAVGLGRFDEAINGLAGPHTVVDYWTFDDGSVLVVDETLVDFSCPGQNDCRSNNDHSFGNPFSATLTATVDGSLSTGRFAGATGSLTGQLSVAGGVGIIKLSGTVTF